MAPSARQPPDAMRILLLDLTAPPATRTDTARALEGTGGRGSSARWNPHRRTLDDAGTDFDLAVISDDNPCHLHPPSRHSAATGHHYRS